MNATAAINFALISEGHCWECRSELVRIADWSECVLCSRRFQIRGRTVIEQIAIPALLRGKLIPPGRIFNPIVRDDLSPVKPLGDGSIAVPDEVSWVVTEWALS